MAIVVLGPLNKLINETASEVINVGATDSIKKVLQRLIESAFDVVDEVLKRVVEMTKEAEASKKKEGMETKPDPGRSRKGS